MLWWRQEDDSVRAVILDGTTSGPQSDTGRQALTLVQEKLRQAGWTSAPQRLAELDIAPCLGCFGCWLKTPGRCLIRDDAEQVLAAAAVADLWVLITPITWGGYSSALKKGMDRLIPLLLPFFQRVQNEAHHPQRYPQPRRLLAVGVMPAPDAEAEAVFHHLVWRNALNLAARWHEAVVLKKRIDLDWLGVRLDARLIGERGNW